MAITGVYDAEPLILARINAADTGDAFTTISSASVLANAGDITPLMPACLVMPGAVEGEVRENFHGPFDETQLWQVSVIVPHIKDPDGSVTTASAAGTLIKMVIEALHQYRLSADFPRLLKYAGREAPIYEQGWAEFPLFFSLSLRMTLASDSFDQ